MSTRSLVLQEQVEAYFCRHPDAEIYLSQPGLGRILGARVLGEFGDDPVRYRDTGARKYYAGASPITRQSGKKTTVFARHVHNNRLVDALSRQAFAALGVSSGARTYYDALGARGVGHNAALRQPANRLVGILHGCLKTKICYRRTSPGHNPPIRKAKPPLDAESAWDVLLPYWWAVDLHDLIVYPALGSRFRARWPRLEGQSAMYQQRKAKIGEVHAANAYGGQCNSSHSSDSSNAVVRSAALDWMGPRAFKARYGVQPGVDRDFGMWRGPRYDQLVSHRRDTLDSPTGMFYAYDLTWDEYAVLATDIPWAAVEAIINSALASDTRVSAEAIAGLLVDRLVVPTTGLESGTGFAAVVEL